jgi:hypothetical protein
MRGLLATLTAERGLAGHLIAATLGHQDEKTTKTAYAAHDLATWSDHHLGAFVGVSHGGNFNITNDPRESAGEYQIAIGVAYRYW